MLSFFPVLMHLRLNMVEIRRFTAIAMFKGILPAPQRWAVCVQGR
jgi:hypothetical protein